MMKIFTINKSWKYHEMIMKNAVEDHKKKYHKKSIKNTYANEKVHVFFLKFVVLRVLEIMK